MSILIRECGSARIQREQQSLCILLYLDIIIDELSWLIIGKEWIVRAQAGVRMMKAGKIIIWKDIIRWSCTRCQNKLCWLDRMRRLFRLLLRVMSFNFFFIYLDGLLDLSITQVLFGHLFLVDIERLGLLCHFKDFVCIFNTLETAEGTCHFLEKHLKSPRMANQFAHFTPYASLIRGLILAETLDQPLPRQYLWCFWVETGPPFLAAHWVYLCWLLLWRGFLLSLLLDYSKCGRSGNWLRTS